MMEAKIIFALNELASGVEAQGENKLNLFAS